MSKRKRERQCDEVQFLTERETPRKRARHSSTATLDRGPSPSPDTERFTRQIIDLTEDLGTAGNHLIRTDELSLASFVVSGSVIRPGTFIRVQPFSIGEYEAEFVQVRIITRSTTTTQINIRGVPFAKNSAMLGKLPKKIGEVCMIEYYHDHDGDPGDGGELVEIDPSDIIQTRQLIYTNALWPTFRSKTWSQHENIVCR